MIWQLVKFKVLIGKKSYNRPNITPQYLLHTSLYILPNLHLLIFKFICCLRYICYTFHSQLHLEFYAPFQNVFLQRVSWVSSNLSRLWLWRLSNYSNVTYLPASIRHCMSPQSQPTPLPTPFWPQATYTRIFNCKINLPSSLWN